MAASVLLGTAADNTGFGFAVGGGGGTGAGAGSVLVACNNGLVSVAGPVPWNRSLERALDEASATGCLNLSGRKLKEFPRGAANHDLTDTTRADLSRNRLSDLPPEVCLLVSLERLDVYQNCLRSLPDHMINLQALTYLNLSRNQLSALPVVLCGLPLKVLIACNNKLVALPQEVGQLRHLTELDVSCNEIRTLPSQVGRLEALRDLNIRRNHLVALPPELAELPLVRLDFSCNKVTSIPLCYTRLSQLHTMVLDNNPLHTPPAQICIKGKVHIFKFLNMEASKTSLDLPEYDRRTLNFGSCVDELYPGRPYGTLDSGFNSVDSGDKRWSANEELSEAPARDVHKEPKRVSARSLLLANGTHEPEQMDFINGEEGEEEEAGGAAGGERGAGERASLSSQFMAYIERRIGNTGSPGKAVFSRTDDSRQRQSRSAADDAPASPGDQIQRGVERMRREARLAALRYDEERHRTRPPQRDAKSPNEPSPEAKNIYPCRRSTHTDDSALFMGEERGGLSPSAGPAHPGSGDAAARRGAGVRPESFLYRLSQREEKRRVDAPATPPPHPPFLYGGARFVAFGRMTASPPPRTCVRACADKCDFLGISVVSQSRDEGAGVCIGSIAEDGAVAADGRLRSGDVLIRVNEVSLEKASGSLAARVLRDAAQRPGLLSLTLLRFWEPAPDGLFTLPRGEPVRPIDPASWVSHTAAVTGKLLPPYGDDEHLSVDGDMATVVKAMMRSDSGVAVRDRMWLKVLIRDAFTGGDAVDWLRRHVAGATERADARRYAAELLERGFIRHAVNARGHKRFSPERYYVVGDLTEMAPMGCRGVGDVFRRGP
ncbi:DISP complex protein LRCH3 isoform X1 [Hippocampus zosterae]|uniref:DISP complex protein LRCH3 isoform X1 n=1 Tax=Hippocampus zosterae TaxID=109293 RepID=UPI00223CA1F8|nr:DISP complex protein LRCH3 isoform X1 [Hippocampus zosterae]